ncbi:hypothetical protein BDV98DRAFT_572276 [Pterulicium gracile]|uniref:Uncharacterized protein n=1 Tax=Pterulicium gracile TaxID=1884261 RepID=A0A5C3Q9U1_9AGAR|nr:hypothetical protein BDV98DRAFT_572276 [Pterula gracilis]
MYFMCKKLFKYFPQVFPTTLICSLYYHEQSAPASQERSLSHYAGDVESSHTVLEHARKTVGSRTIAGAAPTSPNFRLSWVESP